MDVNDALFCSLFYQAHTKVGGLGEVTNRGPRENHR